MEQAYQVADTGIYKGAKPVRDPQYTRWIKRFPCVVCGSTRLVDPMHSGPHGLGQKADDMGCLPGCRKCHEAFDAAPRDFALVHGLDIPALIALFNHLWELRKI